MLLYFAFSCAIFAFPLGAIRGNAKLNADARVGHVTSSLCHLGNIARWTGRKLKWDPIKWEFPGDKEANTWLDYERRPLWKLPKA